MAYINGKEILFTAGSEQPQLYAPTISVNGFTLTISNPASNGSFVTSYSIYLNGAFISESTTTTVDLTDLTQDGTITVRANGKNFKSSADSNAVTQLAAPTNLSITDDTLEFDAVENATSYEVYADGKSIGTQKVYTLSFASDVGTVTVNDVEVTSPYTLKNGDVIVTTLTVKKGFYPEADTPKVVWTVNGEELPSLKNSFEIDRSNTDLNIAINESWWKGTHVMTINFTTTSEG